MKLKKGTGFWGVFCVATGTMISSGLFILPAIVYPKVGPAIFVSYFLAALLMIPAILSKSELATAMPKSGGAYFFIHRSFGAFAGTFSGFAAWYSLCLKSSFALLGIGLFLEPVLFQSTPQLLKFFTVGIIILFTIINILGVKKSSNFQVVLVFVLIGLLTFYIVQGFPYTQDTNYFPFHPQGLDSVFMVMGMIFISYGGLTKIAAIAEEVKNPKFNIPWGMFAAFIVTTSIYVLCIFVTVGVLPAQEFEQTFNPLALAASKFLGDIGFWCITIAAVLAFITTGNAGLLASSRIPLAMAEDKLIPAQFSKVNEKYQTPVTSIVLTALFMIAIVLFLELETLVKVASMIMLMLFFLVNLSLIIMRESKLISYQPSFRSPMYPYVQLFGMTVYVVLIIGMGWKPLLITSGFILFSLLWYYLYAKSRNVHQAALPRVMDRLESKDIRHSGLNDELREIVYEREGVLEDKFDSIIKEASFIDVKEALDNRAVLNKVSEIFSNRFNIEKEAINTILREENEQLDYVIYDGIAILDLDLEVEGKSEYSLVVVRSEYGIVLGNESQYPPVHIIFAFAGTSSDRSFHMHALVSIAQIVHTNKFMESWKNAKTIQDLRNLILLSKRIRNNEVGSAALQERRDIYSPPRFPQ
jgi:amino acid transporter/mannitol/fructose-specific phosphotransferase system IIA component (Ntr-type)